MRHKANQTNEVNSLEKNEDEGMNFGHMRKLHTCLARSASHARRGHCEVPTLNHVEVEQSFRADFWPGLLLVRSDWS
jgi:hypothetical protein